MQRKTDGFTLTELMIVIVIISVLAAVALPIYSKYVRKSRTSEAVSNLGTIAMFEETYYSEADSYVKLAANPATVPNPSASGGRQPFVNSGNWLLLGRVIPDNTMLYFQYEAHAGQYDSGANPRASTSLLDLPSTAFKPGNSGAYCTKNTWNSSGFSATGLGIPANASSNWYYITAVGDQKGGSSARGANYCSLFIKVIDRPDISIQDETE